jgi:type II secretory pathway pseudopilin PulG
VLLPRAGAPHARAFSLIELVMVIGVVMILIALVAPTLGRTIETARDTRRGAALAGAVKLVSMYAGQYKDIAPIAVPGTYENLWRWPEAVLAAGFADGWKEIDPEYSQHEPFARFFLNRAFYDRVEDMTPGQTEPEVWAQCDPIRLASVTFPDRLVQVAPASKKSSNDPWCCLTHVRTYPGPVAFTDGHIETGYWTDFVFEDELYIENNVGWPAFTTWFGHRGRSKK